MLLGVAVLSSHIVIRRQTTCVVPGYSTTEGCGTMQTHGSHPTTEVVRGRTFTAPGDQNASPVTPIQSWAMCEKVLVGATLLFTWITNSLPFLVMRR